MFRISRLTDYGIVVMARLAELQLEGGADGDVRSGDATRNARELADETQLPPPAVSKILKSLARSGLLLSQRGSKGGYSLARPPAEISVVEMITALEGPLGFTECAIHPGSCEQESTCHVRDPWQRINSAVREALERVTLADLARPTAEPFVSLVGLDIGSGPATAIGSAD